MFLFNRATYSLNGSQIENVRDPGRASLMKGILSYSSNLNKQNTFGWILESSTLLDSKTRAASKLENYRNSKNEKRKNSKLSKIF